MDKEVYQQAFENELNKIGKEKKKTWFGRHPALTGLGAGAGLTAAVALPLMFKHRAEIPKFWKKFLKEILQDQREGKAFKTLPGVQSKVVRFMAKSAPYSIIGTGGGIGALAGGITGRVRNKKKGNYE